MPEREIRFLIIGAAKCATTWLQRSLQQCPAFYMPDPELHYFSREYHRGDDWYFRHFDPAPPSAIVGEKSNSYLSEPAAAERICKTLPEVRLVAQLRDPVERAYSDYCMLLRRGEVSRDIEAYLDPRRASDQRFIQDGLYAQQLQRYIDLFGREQLLVLFYDDVKSAPEAQLRMIATHVGYSGELSPPLREKLKDSEAAVAPRWLRKVLRPVRPVLDPVRNTAPLAALRRAIARPVEYPEFRLDLRLRLKEFYADDMARLETLAHRPHKSWNEAANARAIGERT